MASVIVVEGIHDEMRIKSIYPDVNVVTTNGREIDISTIELIKTLSIENDIIIFTDPDSPGEKIRNIITNEVPNCKQAFLRKKDCISKNKKKVGIEHASKECIIDALSNLIIPNSNKNIKVSDLYELGLNGYENSSLLREKISDILNIGKPNAKTFLKRINLLNITKEELEELVCKVKLAV